MLEINDLRNLCNDKSIAITNHARKRLTERNITIENIKTAVSAGEVIEQYENSKPFPGCLVLGKTEQNKYMHIVASIESSYLYIITAYYPDENEWESDLKTRKEKQL